MSKNECQREKKCPVHCYTPAMKIKIKEVMRYSGPRMFRHNPFLAIAHLVSELNGWSGK
ncbi:nitrous oxide-stimulated promoter family protein [Dysgonomonas reticulitermitis]